MMTFVFGELGLPPNSWYKRLPDTFLGSAFAKE
jgi:hypothetical protein